MHASLAARTAIQYRKRLSTHIGSQSSLQPSRLCYAGGSAISNRLRVRQYLHTKTTMKRKAAATNGPSQTKKARPDVPEYHTTPSIKDEHGDDVWPAPKDQMKRARDIILEW